MMSLGMSLGAFADGLAQGTMSGFSMGKKATSKGSADQSRLKKLLGNFSPDGLGAVPPNTAAGSSTVTPPDAGSSTAAPPEGGLVGLLNSHEGGGDYDTLFGFSNRDGGKFAGTKVSNMTLGDVYKFTDPKGDYGQWVAANNNGTVATPVGKFQFVGTTAKSTAQEMGLPDDTPFNAQTQDAMFMHHARSTLAGATTPEARRAALRGQWVGLKNVPDSQLDAAINQFQTAGNQLGALPPIY